jgi:23S rRNA (cytosine1962-C5)-methyltransferase
MNMLTTKGWDDYELLDTGNGKRLERFGKYIFIRPDPQIIWQPKLPLSSWHKADAVFEKTDKGERWVKKTEVPDKWILHYKDIAFYAKLSPFKHTGVFAEQIENWNIIEIKLAKAKEQKVKNEVNILNLFGYTGIASLVCAKNGARVTHVDASKPTVSWARENQELSHLADKPIRWIVDDALGFAEREVRRGITYEGIIMDPPVYGHGPKGEKWDFMKDFPHLITICSQLLSENPLFIIVNSYAVSASSLMLQNVLEDMMGQFKGIVTSGELVLEQKEQNRLLSTGIYGHWLSSY